MSNLGRRLHSWPAGVIDGGALTVTCRNCGLRERLYDGPTFRRDFLDGAGRVLDFRRAPECPKVPTW